MASIEIKSSDLAAYPDVREAVWYGWFHSGWEHFTQYGVSENRNPSQAVNRQKMFCPGSETGNPPTDLAALENCLCARCKLTDFFDEDYYLAGNPDVNEAVANGWFHTGLQHFLKYGILEARNPNDSVDLGTIRCSGYYMAVRSGNARDASIALETYLCASCKLSDFFDEAYYLATHRDVDAAIGDGAFQSGWEHFINHGVLEKRAISACFDIRSLGCPDYDSAVQAQNASSAAAALSTCLCERKIIPCAD